MNFILRHSADQRFDGTPKDTSVPNNATTPKPGPKPNFQNSIRTVT